MPGLFGAQEKAVRAGYLDTAVLPLLNGVVNRIENDSHIVNVDQPEPFNRLLLAHIKK